MSSPSSTSAILVSYNTAELTLCAVDALRRKASDDVAEIIVIDNASTDNTVDELCKHDGLHVVRNTENRGFGAANNQGMILANGSYFLLINTDAFIEPGAVAEMLQRMERDASLAVVGPRLLNQDGSLQRSCFAYPTPARAWIENLGLGRLTRIGRFNHDEAAVVEFVSGACMLVRREAYEAVGGFDEQFFMYAEESDWQRRMTRAGWRIGFEPSAEVVHLGGGSQAAGRINPEFFRSLDRYLLKHHGKLGVASVRLAMGLGAVMRLPIRWILAKRNRTHAAKLRVNWFVLRRCVTGDRHPRGWKKTEG